eukprot:GILK01007278.1.p1 GENE.GILK01007278.1~~GILK01007278.1.p1  ORF type:complete len:282 (-),score=17.06 GILK01007278.1:26-871(-)
MAEVELSLSPLHPALSSSDRLTPTNGSPHEKVCFQNPDGSFSVGWLGKQPQPSPRPSPQPADSFLPLGALTPASNMTAHNAGEDWSSGTVLRAQAQWDRVVLQRRKRVFMFISMLDFVFAVVEMFVLPTGRGDAAQSVAVMATLFTIDRCVTLFGIVVVYREHVRGVTAFVVAEALITGVIAFFFFTPGLMSHIVLVLLGIQLRTALKQWAQTARALAVRFQSPVASSSGATTPAFVRIELPSPSSRWSQPPPTPVPVSVSVSRDPPQAPVDHIDRPAVHS